MSRSVFLSFADSDRERAAAFHAALRRRGVRVQLDDNPLLGGEEWSQFIIANVKRAMATVVFSPRAPEPGSSKVLFGLGVARGLSKPTFVVLEGEKPEDTAREMHLPVEDVEWVRSDTASLEQLADRLTSGGGTASASGLAGL